MPLAAGCSKVVATYRYFRFGGSPDEDAQNSQQARGAGKPRVDHLEVVGPDKEEGPLWVSVALVHAADDHPAAVIDPAGERELAEMR